MNVRLTRKIEWRNFESRINRLKRDYNVGARNLNEYWGCYDAQCSQCYVTVQSRDNSLNNSGKYVAAVFSYFSEMSTNRVFSAIRCRRIGHLFAIEFHQNICVDWSTSTN